MARGTLTLVPDNATARVEVPDDVATDLAEYVAQALGQRLQVNFDTVAEKDAFIAQARTWADDNGYAYRGSPARNLPETALQFRIRAREDAESADTAEADAPAKPKRGK